MTQEELRLAAEYDRGYHDGKAAYNAENWQVLHDRMDTANRMRKLTLNMGSHENLAAICECIYEPAVNWSRGACEMLRTRLTRLLVADIADYDYHDHSKPTMRRELTVDALLDLIRDAAEDYEELLVAAELQANVLDACMQLNKELRRKLDGYKEPDTAESIVRDLTLGNISESDAIARIEKLGSQHE